MAEQGAVLILAGGRSRRMGTDKAQLQVREESLLEWQRHRLLPLGLPVWHSGPDGIVDAWDDFRGPLAGIHSAISRYPEIPFWVVIPVDMPMVPLVRLRQLVGGLSDGYPVTFTDAPLPLGLPVKPGMKETLAGWLEDPDGPRSLRALMNYFHGRWLAEMLSDQECLNVNTPDDWIRFQAGPDY